MATVAVYVAKPPRPLGVSIIAILAMLGGLFLMAIGVFSITGYTIFGLTNDFAFFNNATAAGITLFVIGLITLIVAFGLFGQRVWAWAVIIIIELITLVTALYAFLSPWPGVDWGAFVQVPIPAIVFIYLLLVRDAFV
jgi:hypothetical protein